MLVDRRDVPERDRQVLLHPGAAEILEAAAVESKRLVVVTEIVVNDRDVARDDCREQLVSLFVIKS